MKLYWINAGEAAELYGKRLVGLRVNTEKMGLYPGGMAIVTKIAPDKNTPEIVMAPSCLSALRVMPGREQGYALGSEVKHIAKAPQTVKHCVAALETCAEELEDFCRENSK